ncbi:MAG: hypothetical protein AMK72_02330 [Planctomycetes bacterium SM23_25]|nr:MAG: hypothetical protein AMK72_02330 [Planctomycetes bacterium SM23_25]
MSKKCQCRVVFSFVAIVTGLLAFPVYGAESRPGIELGAPFADNAILQRQMKVPVWGWSRPGAKITVQFAGQTKTATAGKDGKWTLQLEPLKASASPREMVIAGDAGKRVVLKNILVGEVWAAAGQSNMQWPVSKCAVGRVLIRDVLARVKAGKEKMPVIREGKVTNVFSSLHPIEHAKGAWSNGSNFGDYSAISCAFAYDLYRELKIPIGILNCAFSTTTIQAWTPRVGIESGTDDYTKALHNRVLEGDFRTPENKAAWEQYYRDLRDWAKGNAERYKKGLPLERLPQVPGNLRGNRDICWMFNGRMNPVIPYAVRGVIWNQGYANGNEGLVYYHNLHSMIRGWRKLWGKPDLPVYFHQFYCPGGYNDGLSLNSTAEMRLGTWLARDIPHANMASQIDITGSVHYFNKAVPGQRLARHALKNQYGKDIVADGPMFKSYKVEGDRLIVEFDHADGGLVVGETGTQSNTRTGSGLAKVTVIPGGDEKVTLFYLADGNRVWHRAKMKIDGEKVALTAPGVKAPRGVAYGCNGVGWLPNVYNRAMLPTTPFIYYDHKLVTADTWPDNPIKVADVVIDPMTRKRRREILASQFRDDAVIQAGVPTPFWGPAPAGSVVKLSFAGFEKTCKVGPEGRDWLITIPALPAGDEPKTLKVTCTLDGELYAANEIKNIVVGDVWYVAVGGFRFSAPMETEKDAVRLFTPSAAKRGNPMPYRYKLEIPPKGTRHYATWRLGKDFGRNPGGRALGAFANVLGARIHAKTGKPVGLVVMNTRDPRGGPKIQIKSWIGHTWLKQAPSLMADYKALQIIYPDNPAYFANVEALISDWKTFWKTVPRNVLAAKRFDEGQSSIAMPRLAAVTSQATRAYNMLVTGFQPGNFKGIICLTPESFFAEDQGAHFGSEFSVLANCWKETFADRPGVGPGGVDPHFFYTIPSKTLAPKITRPAGIKGKSKAFEIAAWSSDKELLGFIDMVVQDAYK